MANELANPLPEDEAKILTEFKEAGHHGLAPTTAAAFFELYLNGSSIWEIQKQNPAFRLGAIIDAKVKYGWDEQKDRYVRDLQAKAYQRLLQVQMESVTFIADAMAVTHKKYGDSFKKYLQTGDESVLAGFDLGSPLAYHKIIEALMKVTGQDSKKVKLEGNINQNVTGSIGLDDLTQKALNSETAAKLLEILAGDEEK